AHYAGPEWTPVEHAVEAGTIANIPVMVDFGASKPERPVAELATKKLRPGDIDTHVYPGPRGELDPSGRANPGLFEGRKRGARADVDVLRLEEGRFGFVESFGARQRGTQKLSCELTLRDGKVVYDLNGLARPDWDTLPRDYTSTGDPRWEGR